MDSGSNPVRGSASINLHRLDDLRNRLSAKLSKRSYLVRFYDYGNVGGWHRDRLPGLALDIRDPLEAFKAAVEAGEVTGLGSGRCGRITVLEAL
jgi:hypothetical protein